MFFGSYICLCPLCIHVEQTLPEVVEDVDCNCLAERNIGSEIPLTQPCMS